MDAVPIIVLAALVILPLAIRFFYAYTITKSSTKDNDASTHPSPTTLPKPAQPRLRLILTYIAVALYFLLLIAVVLWVLRSFTSAIGLPQTATIFAIVFSFIMFIGLAAGLFLWLRYARKKISFPNKEATPEARLEWENKYADLFSKNLLRMTLIGMGFSLLISALLVITLYYFA